MNPVLQSSTKTGGAQAAKFSRLPSAGTVSVIATDSSAMPVYPTRSVADRLKMRKAADDKMTMLLLILSSCHLVIYNAIIVTAASAHDGPMINFDIHAAMAILSETMPRFEQPLIEAMGAAH